MHLGARGREGERLTTASRISTKIAMHAKMSTVRVSRAVSNEGNGRTQQWPGRNYVAWGHHRVFFTHARVRE